MIIGFISGATGPFTNAPIDTIKTRTWFDTLECSSGCIDPFTYATGLQKSTAEPGQSSFAHISAITNNMWRQEGFRAFYKGITPRVLRVAPGQAIVFAVYERMRKLMETMKGSSEETVYRE